MVDSLAPKRIFTQRELNEKLTPVTQQVLKGKPKSSLLDVVPKSRIKESVVAEQSKDFLLNLDKVTPVARTAEGEQTVKSSQETIDTKQTGEKVEKDVPQGLVNRPIEYAKEGFEDREISGPIIVGEIGPEMIVPTGDGKISILPTKIVTGIMSKPTKEAKKGMYDVKYAQEGLKDANVKENTRKKYFDRMEKSYGPSWRVKDRHGPKSLGEYLKTEWDDSHQSLRRKWYDTKSAISDYFDAPTQEEIEIMIRQRQEAAVQLDSILDQMEEKYGYEDMKRQAEMGLINDGGRYTDENLEFYSPKEFRTQHKSNRQASNDEEQINPCLSGARKTLIPSPSLKASDAVKQHHIKGLQLYHDLLSAGVCREQARGVLSQNLYTEYYGTCNLNNLVKFLDLRIDDHAQWEIRRVAEACRDIAKELWPEAMKHFKK